LPLVVYPHAGVKMKWNTLTARGLRGALVLGDSSDRPAPAPPLASTAIRRRCSAVNMAA
jgi:hypothetical protein